MVETRNLKIAFLVLAEVALGTGSVSQNSRTLSGEMTMFGWGSKPAVSEIV